MSKGFTESRTWQLLNLLADGEFHSGEVLAERLGVSRASVFNALVKAGEIGVVVHGVRGRGYRLARPWQRLDKGEVIRLLGSEAEQFEIDILPQAESSNSLLMQRARRDMADGGAPSGSVLAVELQTVGRGRMGRTWLSGLGSALTFSVVWRFTGGLPALSGLSLAVGVATARALGRLGSQGVGLKWPNDILTEHGKLGGVLIEAQGDVLGPSVVVIGIGLNCTLPFELLQRIDQPACGLDETVSIMPSRSRLLATVLTELAAVLRQFEQSGFVQLRNEWEKYHIHQNCEVSVHMADGQIVRGVALGVSESGELCLETAQGMRRCNSGEVGGQPG